MCEAVPVTAPWQLTWTGTIWPGSHGDQPIHQLMGLTAGQLGKGIGWWELEAWGVAGSPKGETEGQWSATHREMGT